MANTLLAVKGPKNIREDALNWLLPQVDTRVWKNERALEWVEIDLSATRFIDVAGMGVMVCFLDWLRKELSSSASRNFGISLRMPQAEVLSYLKWMQFFTTLQINDLLMVDRKVLREEERILQVWRSKLESVRPENGLGPGNVSFLPLRYIPKCRDLGKELALFETEQRNMVNDSISAFSSIFEKTLGWSKRVVSGFLEVMYEVYQNVFYHSSSWGIIGAQAFKDRIVIACMDVGVGIRTTLEGRWKNEMENRGKEWNDLNAIELAIEPGVSRLPRSGEPSWVREELKGLGLYKIQGYTNDRGGALILRSGMGERISQSAQRVRKHLVPFLPGTQIVVRIPVTNR